MLLGDEPQGATSPEIAGRGILIGRAEVKQAHLIGLVVGQRGRAAVCPAVVSGPIVGLLALVVQDLKQRNH